jgi:hypothetical protein
MRFGPFTRRCAACTLKQPIKGLTMMTNSQYNRRPFEDA